MAGNLGKTRPGAGYTGTRRRRHRREVAGPYRSQSSVPSVRKQATRREHRKAPVALPLRSPASTIHSILSGVNLPTQPADPRSTLELARYAGIQPAPSVETTQPALYRLAEKARVQQLAEHENLKQPEDLTNAILIASGGGDLLALLRAGAAKGLAETEAKQALAAASKQVAAAGAKQVVGAAETKGLLKALASAAKPGVVRGAAGRAVAKAEPEVIRGARQVVARQAGRAADRLPTSVRVGTRVAGRAVAAPVKHPFTAPLALQAPAAAIHGDPSEFLKAAEGQGVFADISGALGGGAAAALPGKVGQIANEAVNLPAVVLPSTYLLGKAGINAAQGNPAEAEKLWKEWVETGLLPAIVKGDPHQIKQALDERPLYSGLEASGGASVLGRGAGALTRGLTNGKVGGRARPDLAIEGYPAVSVQRQYSPDLIRQLLQRAHDQRTGNVIRPGTGHRFTPTLERSGDRAFRKAVVRDAGDRFSANAQDAQRLGRQKMLEVANELAPRKRGQQVLRKVAPKATLDHASADVVVHAIERVIQHPETFHADLTQRLHELNQIAADKHENGIPVLNRTEMEANREMAANIEKALKRANPEHVVDAANTFIKAQQPIIQELADRGILTEEQAAKAAAIPFARVHQGAGHGVSKADKAEIARLKRTLKGADVTKLTAEQRATINKIRRLNGNERVLDKHGEYLPLEAIQAEMARRGIEAPGFISHRAPRRSDFFATTTERGSLPKGKRSGLSAEQGTYQSNFEGVIRQLVRSRGLLDRVKTWDAFISRFGQMAHGIKVSSMRAAQRVLSDPARYGLNPNIEWRAVRRQPFTAMKSEIQAALEHQDPHVAEEPFLSQALNAATSEHGPEGDIVFMPSQVVRNMEEQFQPLGTGLKAAQFATQGLKRAVLPFSPSYYFGNAIDNMIRTALAGIGPQHFIAGHQLSKQLSDEKVAQLTGSAYSSVEKLAAHRSHEDFQGSALEGVASAAATFRHAPGLRNLIDVVNHVSHSLLAVNSLLTERLPQYGALGKIAMQDVRNAQGQWAAVLHLQPKAIEDLAKGLENSDTIIRYQKGIEEIYGNWSRMSPAARKYMSNFFPFWTWSRAALKLVYKTLPAHHPIQTALLTAAARMTQAEREKLGLDQLSSEPLPNFLQGGIPIRGSVAPWGKYTSFGYAGHPLESVAGGVLPTLKEGLNAAEGKDWKGDPLGGSELSHIGDAATGFLGSYVPGYNTVKGISEKGLGYLSPFHVESPDALPYLRSLHDAKTITVPNSGSNGGLGGSGAPWRGSEGLSGGAAPWR